MSMLMILKTIDNNKLFFYKYFFFCSRRRLVILETCTRTIRIMNGNLLVGGHDPHSLEDFKLMKTSTPQAPDQQVT